MSNNPKERLNFKKANKFIAGPSKYVYIADHLGRRMNYNMLRSQDVAPYTLFVNIYFLRLILL